MLNPDFRDLLSAFIDANVEFVVVGGYAMAAHRLPRATKDLDLWVRPSAENAHRVLRALDMFGAPRQGLTAADLQTEGTIYQVGVPPHRVDVVTVIDGVHFEEGLARSNHCRDRRVASAARFRERHQDSQSSTACWRRD